MSVASPPGCVRCGTILLPLYRFCPECGLPVSGEGVLSTEIGDVRRRAESQTEEPVPSWRRYLLPTVATVMFAFVVGLGLVLFNRPLLNRLFPPTEARFLPTDVGPKHPRWEPEWTTIADGRFPVGDPDDPGADTSKAQIGEIKHPFEMSTYEVRNELWFEYLNTEWRNLDATLWYESFPRDVVGWSGERGAVHLRADRRDYPVTNVSPLAIAEFCAYLTRRLNKTGYEIRIPTNFEWAYAAGGRTGRTYTWGEGDVLVPKRGVNAYQHRAGVQSSYAVDAPELATDDTSAFGVVAMGTNVSEWTLLPDKADRRAGDPDRELVEFLDVANLRRAMEEGSVKVAWRGASSSCTADDARRLARVWAYRNDEPRDARGDVGIRLVKVKVQ